MAAARPPHDPAPAPARAPVVWEGPDGPETAPPVDIDADPALPPSPPLLPSAAAVPPPLPATATALRADLLALVDAVAAHAVALNSGAVWASRRHAGRRAVPLAAAALRRAAPSPPAAAAAAAPHENPATGQPRGASLASPTWRALLADGGGASQCELSRPAHEARRARLFAGLSGWARVGLAAVQGGRAALWLSAVPVARGGRGTIPGTAMRVAARLWLGAPPRSDPPRPRCACGAAADAGGRHFLTACSAHSARRTALHHHIVSLVAAALRRAPRWGAVAVERPLDGTDGALRPDVRATEAATGAVTWTDVSVASPWPDTVAARVRTTPLRAVAAVDREAAKTALYAPELPASTPPHAFTPVVWETRGRIGPASDAWLKAALAGPQLASVRAGLLLDVSLALWRSQAWAVAGGYSHAVADVEDFGAPGSRDPDVADTLAWAGGDLRVPDFLRGATGHLADSGPLACHISD